VRKTFETRFSSRAMALGYVALYEKLVGQKCHAHQDKGAGDAAAAIL
jgi:hypothetical protein